MSDIQTITIDGVTHELQPWRGRRNYIPGKGGPPCNCPKLYAYPRFCVCEGICYCPEHGTRCVGSHD